MFIIINNESFKCTEMNVSSIFSPNYYNLLNMYAGTAVREPGDERTYKCLDKIVEKKYIQFTKLEKDDPRMNSEVYKKFILELTPTEHICFHSTGNYIITHPAGEVFMFNIYDNTHLTVSKMYDNREECEAARDRILEHVNHIVYELPREEV